MKNSLDPDQLAKDESDSIEGPITNHEAALILKAMSNNQSQGSDGFSRLIFLKMFWKKISHFVVCSINYGFSK